MGKGKRLSLEEKREGKRWGESEVTVGIESIHLHVQQEGIKRKRVAVRNEFMMYSGYNNWWLQLPQAIDTALLYHPTLLCPILSKLILPYFIFTYIILSCLLLHYLTLP